VPSKRETPSPPFLLNSVDRLGRPIDPSVLSVAQGIAQRALSQAEKLLGDPAVALNLFEEAAAAVSQAVENRKHSTRAPIRDLRAYLLHSFRHRITQERRKQVSLRNEGERIEERHRTTHEITSLERDLLVDELLAAYDKVTQEIILRHLEGFSWDEVGERYGISAHAARVRYSKALQRARKLFKNAGHRRIRGQIPCRFPARDARRRMIHSKRNSSAS
jgi:RNA polymerase sigma factor (sigma-70 family)